MKIHKSLKILWFFVSLVALSLAALPFILAEVTGVLWLAWFAVITIPFALAIIALIFTQRKMTKDFFN